jgi:large subunit ribosomal protein L13
MFDTYFPKRDEIEKKWYVVDATDKILGRLASEIAQVLRGKHKPTFTPHMDNGDYVVVINADKIRVTGNNKEVEKEYFSHSGYLGNEKVITYKELLNKHPEEVIKRAVKGMLPSNKLGRKIFKKLKVYKGSEHPHQAQNPEPLEVEA